MRRLLCDALDALWVWVTAPVRKLVADAVTEARETQAAREVLASLHWTAKDDQAFDRYARHVK